MQIIYRLLPEGAEIVKCFGTDGHIELPDMIGEHPVCTVASYAFSDRDESWEELYENGALCSVGEKLPGQYMLAGEAVESVVLPDTVRAIGKYVFYGCKCLTALAFSNKLTNIGTGCFNLCGSAMHITVRMNSGNQSCVKEILDELWQRVDVTLIYVDGESAKLVFPEHYEEARENTPARMLYTHHHGSGNNYRQCFYNREMDFRKYDELFAVGKVYDRLPVLADLVFFRLLHPVRLRAEAEQAYRKFVAEREEELAVYLTEQEWIQACEWMGREKMWSPKGICIAIDHARRTGAAGIQSRLMDIQMRMPRAGKKRFDL